MTNCYVIATAETEIPCRLEDYMELHNLLGAEEPSHGMTFAWREDAEGGKLYAFTEDSCDPYELSQPVRDVLVRIMRAANLSYWEFGYAWYSDRPKVSSAGGGSFRITAEGDVVYASLVFE
jgi:hypothetical protein